MDNKARENDGRHLGFRFKNDVFYSSLFFAENGVFFRSGEMALRVEKKSQKKKYPRGTGGAPPPPPCSAPGRPRRLPLR
jgi:hypothetical protein